MSKKENKKIQFANYLKKWGLNRYRFFVNYYVYVYDIDYLSSRTYYIALHNHEITCTHTLIKNMNSVKKIILRDYDQKIDFENFDALKQYTLIRKLSGV